MNIRLVLAMAALFAFAPLGAQENTQKASSEAVASEGVVFLEGKSYALNFRK